MVVVLVIVVLLFDSPPTSTTAQSRCGSNDGAFVIRASQSGQRNVDALSRHGRNWTVPNVVAQAIDLLNVQVLVDAVRTSRGHAQRNGDNHENVVRKRGALVRKCLSKRTGNQGVGFRDIARDPAEH